ncbi:regulator of G-protein signaling protein-like [Myxocyprinus asiaticus]|uniref:regulator of G-protein signaling protein-like n=1 Tax=Myxocyprinus asiaticus TaxID=70543 RepID=UPI002222CA8E|nr:regulator of G-protein signaling protein-like [Myxocyprinus asiaticus]
MAKRVFGQTPLFLLSENKWLLCPNLPLAQVNTGGFLKWLESHRLVLFKQTELYHNFTLCKEILNFVSSNSTGEELALFCVRVSMLLNMKMEDEFQTMIQLTLLTPIRLTHLSEGSAILSLCHLHTDDITKLLSKECPLSARKHKLSEMRKKAIYQLQSYWLPQFLHCCKSWVWHIPECLPIVQEYMSLSSPCPAVQSPSPCEPKQCQPNPTCSTAKSYCSKRTKRRLWSVCKPNTSCAQHMKSNSICLWLPPTSQQDQEGFKHSNIAHPLQELHRNLQTGLQEQVEIQEGDAVVQHTCIQTPVCQFPCCMNLHTPASDLQFYLQPALSAEGLAGGPFRSFLRTHKLVEKLQVLNLWQDLELFLQLVLKAQGEDPVYAQRQSVGQRIKKTYLKETMQCHVPLDLNTSHHLQTLLPSSAAVPWIYVAQYEICKVLREAYESFLDAEDKAFLSDLTSHIEEIEDSGQLLFTSFETETEAQIVQMDVLLQCEGCGSRGNPDALSQENWALVAQQDLRRGGSLIFNFTKIDSFEHLATWKLSDIQMQPAQGVSVTKSIGSGTVQRKTLKKYIRPLQRPSSRPRSFEDIFTTLHSIDYFKHFLEEHNAEGALLFILEAEELRTINQPKRQNNKICDIVNKFFHRKDPVDYLQCNADIIKGVQQMDVVSSEVIFTIQHLVTKSLEATWFKRYQDTYTPCITSSELNMRGALLKDKIKNVWEIFSGFIRSVRKFLAAVEDRQFRAEFEWYLRKSYEHFSEPCVVSARAQQTFDSTNVGETFKPKIRSIINKKIIVNFLGNDLSFYLECERFRYMADAGVIMASAGMYGETDYAMLYHKAELIINIFLQSDTSQKLRINISESQRDVILQRFVSGKVDRTLFYSAMMDVFPVLVYCWKKFCCLKMMKHLYGDKALRNQTVCSSSEVQNPSNINQQNIQTVKTVEVKEPTLHFSTQQGLILMLPQTRLKPTGAPVQKPSAKYS